MKDEDTVNTGAVTGSGAGGDTGTNAGTGAPPAEDPAATQSVPPSVDVHTLPPPRTVVLSKKPTGPQTAVVTETIDLDEFINEGQGGPGSANTGRHLPTELLMGHDRVTVVGILLDDSGSMRGLEGAVTEGLDLAVKAFGGAKGSGFYLEVAGFKKNYFSGPLDKVGRRAWEGYYPDYESSPVITQTLELIKTLQKIAQKYRASGIATRISLLIMTDGQPNQESEAARERFTREVNQLDYVVGMSVEHDRSEGDNVSRGFQFFREMGIKKVMTPKADQAEVRHSINEFSQSVASIAQS